MLSVGRLLGVLSGPGFCGRGPGPLLLGGIVAARAIIRIRGYTPPRRFGATGLLLGGRLPVRLQLPPGRPRTGRPGSDTVNCAGGADPTIVVYDNAACPNSTLRRFSLEGQPAAK